jgi:hypothetical protein
MPEPLQIMREGVCAMALIAYMLKNNNKDFVLMAFLQMYCDF